MLKEISNVLRHDVLKMTTSAMSGHPTSCLSCAEIMSVLFFDEMKFDVNDSNNSNNDEFILSKGHASPILYSALFRAGCINDDLDDLRKINSSLEGHPVPSSLSWVKVATGSLGQGLSVGVGFALASKLQKRNFRTFVLLGDSELAEGSNFESLEIAGKYELNNLVAVVDVNRLGQRGETLLGHDMKKYKKMFDGFGWNVISINGHSIKQIKNALKKSRNSKKPVLILAKTLKGKGVSFLENKNGFHGKALNDEDLKKALKEIPANKMPLIEIQKPENINFKFKKSKFKFTNYKKDTATREAYGNALLNLAKSNLSVLAIDAEVSNSTKSEIVRKNKPKQFIESYIAEQNMVGTALGLSKKGFNVFASTFAAFFSRAHDQIRMSAVSSANLTFVGSHAGVSIGKDGASQMGLEDIAIFRSLPNSQVFYPSDAVSTERLTYISSKLKGIKYIRTTRPKTPILYKKNEKFPVGEFKVLRQSKKDKCVFVGSGITVFEALKAHKELLKRNKNVAVIDLYSIKPFDFKKFIDFVKKHGKKIVLAEDHYTEGGIGEMVFSRINNSGIQMKHLSVNKLPHSGEKDELLKIHEIDWESYIKSFEGKWQK